MRKLASLLLIVAFCRFTFTDAVGSEPTWNRDLENAKEVAVSEDKALFILFTGHGWCHACELVDQEVFRTEEFVDATTKNYVFVELDYNFGDGPQEERRKSELMQLRSHYLAPAVPTVVLADSDGLPYAFFTGYEAGSGPGPYLEQLAVAEEAKRNRDTTFTAAESETGLLRAKLLDDALEQVDEYLGVADERGDDPLLRFYAETIQEILELTGNEGSIAEKYRKRRERRSDWLSSEALFAKLKEFNATKDYAGAINYIDTCLEAVTSESSKWRLRYSRQVYLEWSDRNEEALANCRRLLALDDVPEDYREKLLDREAYNLFRLNRVAEGLARYDQRVADAADDRDKRRRLLGWKAQMMLGRDPVSQSISIWEAYRSETAPGTDDWLIATALLARELRRANHHERAIHVLEELPKENPDAWLLLDAAESYVALGRHREARKHIEDAESVSRGLAESPRQSERDKFAHVATRIKELRQKLAEKPAEPQRDGTER